MTVEEQNGERRRNPRYRVRWRAIIEAGDCRLHAETADVSSFGPKLLLDERLDPGTRARVRLNPDEQRPLEVESLVWRADPDGLAFFFFEGCPCLIPALERI